MPATRRVSNAYATACSGTFIEVHRLSTTGDNLWPHVHHSRQSPQDCPPGWTITVWAPRPPQLIAFGRHDHLTPSITSTRHASYTTCVESRCHSLIPHLH